LQIENLFDSMLPIAIEFVDFWSTPFLGCIAFKYGVKQLAVAWGVALLSLIMTSLDLLRGLVEF
jgi:hypothetical protein